jgi:ParG
MSKKITFTPKPSAATPPDADAWVSGEDVQQPSIEKGRQAPAPAKTKRFTFDVSEALHRRVKARCAEKGVDIADEMRRLLEQHFPPS